VQEFFLTLFLGIEHTPSSAQRWRLFLKLLFISVTLSRSALLIHRFWCCPPVISSITNDHDEFFDPLCRGRVA
jgi:hypothetical protein